MSEGNERNLESIAPEAVENENIEMNEEAAQMADAVETADAAPANEEMDAPAQRDSDKKKKRKKSNILVPVAIVLVVVLVAFGTLVGYGLGRVRSDRDVEQVEAVEEQPEDLDEVQPYDAFVEELTQENQHALDALAGEDSFFSADAEVLLGEEGLLGEDPLQSDELAGGEGAQKVVEPVVVAEFGDGQTLMSGEVLEEYYEQLSTYILSGYSEEDVAEMLLDEVMESMVKERVLAGHAKEMGLDELSEEDYAKIEAQAKETFEEYRTYYRNYVAETEDMTDAEANAAAEKLLLEYEGITYEGLLTDTEANWWQQKLYDAVTADITVDDAEIRADYGERLEEQKQNFTEFPEDYEFNQSNGEVIVYNLPGYRAVKVLKLGFEDPEAIVAVYGIADELTGWDDEEAVERQEEPKEDLDGYYANLETRAQEALEQLRAGADMDEMILSIGSDDGMLDERMRKMGYYVSSDSTLWPEAFISAAMALEEVGDYSEPVRTEEGVCILQYLGDVPEGEVPFEDVRDVLAEEALDTLRYRAYAAKTEEWLEEANPSYYPERMQ